MIKGMAPRACTGRTVLLTTVFLLIIPLIVFLTAPNVSADRALPRGSNAVSLPRPLAAGTVMTITYTSSVDGASLRYHEYVLDGYDSNVSCRWSSDDGKND
jgi:hypothetical protein